jgi:hypothetical protein
MVFKKDPYYASWDPGGSESRRTIGLTYWAEDAEMLHMTSLTQEEYDREIQNIPPTVKVFILERYIPFGHISHTGNKLTTAQRIGDIKGYARRNNIKVVEQDAKILTIGCMWAGVKRPRNSKGQKKHLPDYLSSYVHGYYYLFNLGLIRPKVLDDE